MTQYLIGLGFLRSKREGTVMAGSFLAVRGGDLSRKSPNASLACDRILHNSPRCFGTLADHNVDDIRTIRIRSVRPMVPTYVRPWI